MSWKPNRRPGEKLTTTFQTAGEDPEEWKKKKNHHDDQNSPGQPAQNNTL
jgi:hypothetical protein